MICSTLLKFTLFARNTKPHVVKSTDLHCILNTNINKCRGEKLRRGKNARSSRRQWPMADPGEVPGGPPAPLIFRPNWGPKGRKRFFFETAPSPTPLYLRVWMTTSPAYLKVWIRHWPHRRISRRWNQSGIDEPCDSFRRRLCAPSNLSWKEMKINKMILKSNTRKENLEFSRSATY